jgi:hypothetical protein
MTLEIFDAEASQSSGALRTEISLRDVVDGGGVDAWSEAVAVVEELCQILTQHGGEARVPAHGDVLLTAGGQVLIASGGRGERGPVAVGRLLHELLGGTDVPVQLRLFLSQATAPDTHGSIREFAAALAYFGRPDRTELVQALFARYQARPAGAGAPAAPPALPPQTSVEASRFSPTPRRRRGGQAPRAGWVAAALLLVVAFGGVAWVWGGGASDRIAETTAADVTGAVTGAFGEFTSTARELMGEPRIVIRDDAGASPALQPGGSTTAGRSTPAARDGSSVASASAPGPAATPAARRAAASTPPATGGALAPIATAAIVVPPPAADEPRPAERVAAAPVTVAAVDTSVVYSRDDPEVVPPSLLVPQLPLPLVTVEDGDPIVNQMEVLVAVDGTVERVRLVAGPRRMPDMMLLSGAKTWRFEPARKDGVAVRYRTILSWTVTP